MPAKELSSLAKVPTKMTPREQAKAMAAATREQVAAKSAATRTQYRQRLATQKPSGELEVHFPKILPEVGEARPHVPNLCCICVGSEWAVFRESGGNERGNVGDGRDRMPHLPRAERDA